MLPIITHFRSKETLRLNVREWRKALHENRNKHKSGVAKFISDKIDFKTETETRDKENII